MRGISQGNAPDRYRLFTPDFPESRCALFGPMCESLTSGRLQRFWKTTVEPFVLSFLPETLYGVIVAAKLRC